MDFSAVGIRPAHLLLPAAGVAPETWACVACDQYTSQPEFWQEADRLVGEAPSTLRLVVPECYLHEAETRIPQIHRTMEEYLQSGILVQPEAPCMVLMERTTESGTRHGLVCAVDLEAYDFTGEKSLIRPTEETVTARLPARMAVRREALVETGHVMLLIDDPEDTVLGGLRRRLAGQPYDYDFDMMQDLGHLRGRRVTDDALLQGVGEALAALKDALGEDPLLFAVGDGNHSLASAKAHWMQVKQTLPEAEQATHPARYAMAEIVNIHDPALKFEPIHRVLTHVEETDLLLAWTGWCRAQGMILQPDAPGDERDQVFPFVTERGETEMCIFGPVPPLPVANLQAFLDAYLADHPEVEIDYIHGDDVLRRLASAPGCAGFLLPALDKFAFFRAINALGTLPRKTFSMGHAHEKRCYYECRRIR